MATFFTAPTVAEVSRELKLRTEQIKSSYTADDVTAEIEARIPQAEAYVETKLTSQYEAADLEAMTANEKSLATEATALSTAMAVMYTSGALNKTYEEEAAMFERRRDGNLKLLLESIANRVGEVTEEELLSTIVVPRTHSGSIDVLWP